MLFLLKKKRQEVIIIKITNVDINFNETNNQLEIKYSYFIHEHIKRSTVTIKTSLLKLDKTLTFRKIKRIIKKDIRKNLIRKTIKKRIEKIRLQILHSEKR